MTSARPFLRTFSRVLVASPDASMAYTCFAPARAANMDRMPVPAPTSITMASLNTAGLLTMKRAYETVRVVSLSIISWMSFSAYESK